MTAHTPTRSFALVDLGGGQTHALQVGSNSIGRSTKSRIVLDDAAVSRRHAVLTVGERGDVEIYDRGSRNGVRVNGKRIFDVVPIAPGDLVQIHDFRFLLVQARPDGLLLFTDEALGLIAWDERDSCWHFGVAFPSGQYAVADYGPTNYKPTERSLPPATPEWEQLRRVYWQVKFKEPAARAIAERSAARYIDGTASHLARIFLTTDKATFVYEYGEGAVCVGIDPSGAVDSEPVLLLAGFGDDE